MKLRVNTGKGLALAAAILLVIALGMLIPGQPDLEKLQALVDRGNYSAVISGAQRLLAKKPEANEYRDFLVRSQLAVGDWAGALANTGYLYAAGWDTELLESQFSVAIIAADAVRADEVLAVAEEELARRGGWPWLEKFALDLLLQSGAVERAPEVLSHLSKAEINAGVADQIWGDLVLAADDLEAAWRIAAVLDERDIPVFGLTQSRQLLFLHHQSLPEDWLRLQGKYPQEPLLAAIRSRVMPEGGLDWLVAWEEGHGLAKEDEEAYSSYKMYYGPQGRLAWKEGNSFYVYDGKATHALPLDNLIAVGAWSPDGKAMLLISAQEAYPYVVLGKALHYKIGGSVKELELEFERSSMPLRLISLLNQDELTWPFPLATGQYMLGKYNLRTGEITMTGIVLPQEVSGRRVLAQGVDGIYVYELN